MQKFIITTLGCKVNQYESEAIAQSLKAAGWVQADREEPAGLCIVNTCTVTHKAAMQSRQAIRQIIRANPDARIMVTGCYAQTEPDVIGKIQGIHDIVGHSDKHRIPEMVLDSIAENRKSPSPAVTCHDISHERVFRQLPVTAFGSRTRPFLKIQDGCDAFCTYCIVPHARGRSRSMPPETVLEHITQLKAAGYHEVVLTGIHVGCYGLDFSPQSSLYSLLRRIHDSEAIDRVRLSSVEPHELTTDIISLVAESDILCPHFHIPLQSGDEQILKRMHRPYTRDFFRELVTRIHEQIPHAGIGVDTLIGFPGEDDAAFENTYALIRDLPVTYLHVFPFSPRKGTPAYTFADRVPSEIVKARCQKMRELGLMKKKAFYKSLIGQTVKVLVEGRGGPSDDFLKGVTPNYVPVLLSCGQKNMKNTIVKARINELKDEQVVLVQTELTEGMF